MSSIDTGGTGGLSAWLQEHADTLPALVAAAGVVVMLMFQA